MSRINLIGRVFGRLTVIESGKRQGKAILWRCRCQCGQERQVEGWSLRHGRTKSCGCLKSEVARSRNGAKSHAFRHGGKIGSHQYLYATWTAHLRSILSEQAPWHKYYQGMAIAPEWSRELAGNNAYLNFEKYVLSNIGERPSSTHSLDIIEHRIGFVPGNLRWATKEEQVKNRRYIFNSSSEVLLSFVSTKDLEDGLARRIPEYGIGVAC